MSKSNFEPCQDDGVDDSIFAELSDLSQGQDVTEILKDILDLGSKAYWKKKDLQRVVVLSVAGIGLGLTTANQNGNVDSASIQDLLGVTKALAYNLASFTWPGWDEPGIEIGPTDLRIGLDAAKTNLRLAIELSKGDLPLSRGHWILGAHFLAADEHSSAAFHFAEASQLALRARSETESSLASAFSILNAMAENPGNTSYFESLEKAKSALAALEGGPEFVVQIETAQRVFLTKF